METIKDSRYLIARANYRKTCTDLRDGVLSQSWHESNDHLRLMGVGITGACKLGISEVTNIKCQSLEI